MMDLVGQTLGQYRIEAPLDAGGMGQVFRGRHVLLERTAAIKVMSDNLAVNSTFRARFLQEAKSAAALQHPHIVAIYDFGEQNGQFYLVMELMTGGSLRSLFRQRSTGQPWPLSLGLDLVRQAAEGLAAAQAQGVVHRDIKPDNLLLNRLSTPGQSGERYELKISDFGLARMAESGGLTSTGVPMGTLAYMSPEQCQGEKLDGRTDIYALGVVLYEVATGYLPFQIDNFHDALYKHCNTPPPPPHDLRPDLPPLVEEIILRCLAKKPEERYASGAELAQDLQRALGNNVALATVAPIVLPKQGPGPQPTRGTALHLPGPVNTLPPSISITPASTGAPKIRVLDQGGATRQIVELSGRPITVGRQPGSDIVLQTPEVSRQHLRVQWDGRQVLVTDLGSSNGTSLGNTRLTPQVGQPWVAGQQIHLGPFWLRLEGSNLADDLSLLVPPPSSVGYSHATARRTPVNASMVGGARFSITVEPDILTITPGQSTAVQVKLINVGSIVDWLTITAEGVPPHWVQGPGREIQLNPGQQETVQLNVQVARMPLNYANDYPVLIRARSREKRDESVTARGRWTVLSFREDALRLEPRRVGGRGKAAYALMLSNGGNALGRYTLSGDDDEQKLDYRFGQNVVEVAPGQQARVPLSIHVRRHWLGRDQRYPFQIHSRPVVTELGPPASAMSQGPALAPLSAASTMVSLSAAGEFVNKPVLPPWVLPAVGVVLAASLVLGVIFSPLHKLFQPSPTPTAVVIATPTPTPTNAPTPTQAPTATPTQAPSPTATPIITPTSPPQSGSTWSAQSSGTSNYLYDVTWSGSRYVVVGDGGTILTSDDGNTWASQSSPTSMALAGVVWARTQFVAVGTGGTILTSPDGVTWTLQNSGTTYNLEDIVWSGSLLVAVGNNGTIMTSPDGVTWTPQNSGTTNNLGDVTWSGSQFVVVGGPSGGAVGSGTVLTSPDGVTWTPQNSSSASFLRSLAWSGSRYVVVGNGGAILTSPDGVTWTPQNSGTPKNLGDITWTGSQFVVVGDSGTVLTSPDGVTWTPQTSGTNSYLRGIIWSGSRYVTVGRDGAILTAS